VIALLLALPAHAQQSCLQPMSRIQLGAALGEVTDDLEDGDRAEATVRLTDLADRMPCLSEPADPALIARYARYRAVVASLGQDEDLALRWGLASRLADPDLPWDDALWPPGSPLRQRLDGAALPAPIASVGGFVLPKGGAVYVDGAPLALPATTDLPHLAQRFDGEGERLDGRWLDGPSFPPDWIAVDAGVVATAEPTPVARTDRRRAPIGPILASGLLLGASGATYALAGASAGSMDGLSTSEDLTAARSRANAFVVASGATFAGALGVGVGAVVLSF
jgi:hypothetical protein